MFPRWFTVSNKKSILVIGPRRAGKTTYLKNTFPGYQYITLDDLDALEWARKDPKGFITRLGSTAIIDEIQRSPELTIAVKYAIDNEAAHFVMTGSSSIGLLDSAADSLAGRIEIYSLPTACWGEEKGLPTHLLFGSSQPFPIIKEAMRSLEETIRYGAFPEVVTAPTAGEKEELLRNYKNTYFVRDLMQMANIENLEGIQAIYANIGRSIGSHLEVSNFARESALSVPTAKKYLNTLYQSELAFSLQGFQFGPAKRFIKASKSYFSDNGIITALRLRLSEGQLLENFVISELEKRRKLGFIKAEQFFYYKSAAGREIDLIFEAEGTLHAIEIKAAKTIASRDTANLREFIKHTAAPVKGFLFYMGEEYAEQEGIQILPVAALYRGR